MAVFGSEGWRRWGFELVAVFLGVLVALLVDSWNSGRIERGLERQYIARLTRDLDRDRAALDDLAAALDAKMSALQQVQRLRSAELRSQSVSGKLTPLLVTAHSAGFGVLQGNSTTFEDLRSTGNLSLLRDPELRSILVAYYEAWRFDADRVAARQSTFPALAYSLLPTSAYDSNVYFDAPAPDAASIALDSAIVPSALSSLEGRRAIAAELNYARFFRGVVGDLSNQAASVAEVLSGASGMQGPGNAP